MSAAAVARALDGARLPALVVTDEPLVLEADVATVVAPGDAKPDGHFRTVLLAVSDVDDLRRAVARLAPAGWARMVAVVVADHDRALTLRPDPTWPALTAVVATAGHTRLEFDARLEALPVLRALARSAAAPVVGGDGGLRTGRPGQPVDDPAVKHPVDIAVDPPTPPVVSEVTGRAPVTLAARDLPLAVDEAVYHPIGWRRTWTRPVVDLDPTTRLTPALVRDLRDAQGVRLAPGHDPRVAAGLAMSGIPLLGATTLVGALGAEVSLVDDAGLLADPVRREDRSVRLRRAALTHHSSLAVRHRLATAAGVRATTYPCVTLVLHARRPDLLDAAIDRVARQHPTLPGAEVEIVVAAHGFTPDPAVVAAAPERSGVPVTFLPAATDTVFESMRAAAAAARGDVVVGVDDTHDVGPHLVTDLLLARRYSGADTVAAVDGDDAETYGRDTTGAPRLVDRAVLREPARAVRAYRTHASRT
ncbi:hypothetical protein ABFT23_03810 [Nocardioides sp. C4-1]|uniref:hypothetical protein n=1 Tax=Nocardioides sp. C4-1 TaxID=3151851 RepID=UPI0032662386